VILRQLIIKDFPNHDLGGPLSRTILFPAHQHKIGCWCC